VKRHGATIIHIVLISTRPLTRDALKNVHHAPVIQMVNQTVQLSKERYTETSRPHSNGHVYYGLVNVYRTHHQPTAASDKDYPKVKD
jgi:hypothetical protein